MDVISILHYEDKQQIPQLVTILFISYQDTPAVELWRSSQKWRDSLQSKHMSLCIINRNAYVGIVDPDDPIRLSPSCSLPWNDDRLGSFRFTIRYPIRQSIYSENVIDGATFLNNTLYPNQSLIFLRLWTIFEQLSNTSVKQRMIAPEVRPENWRSQRRGTPGINTQYWKVPPRLSR
jgi:hypothetical protein